MLEQFHHVVVYANPYSALCFARDKGFVPVARPDNVVDETIVVARAGAEVLAAPRIASATDKLIIHNLGLQVLARVGIDAAAAEFKYVGNHLNPPRRCSRARPTWAFVFNETWAGMSATTAPNCR